MTTGDTFVTFTLKKIFGIQDFSDRWFGYQQKQILDANQRAFGQDGFFGGVQTTMSVHSGNLVQIDNDVNGTDNLGHFLITDAKLAGRDVGLAFQNSTAVLYSVGLHYTERPRGIAINPRTARPDFVGIEETIGERAEPDLVTVTGGGTTLTFEVDSVVDPFSPSVVNNAGRICAVWKKFPGEKATVESAAVEEVVVTWSGTHNEIVTTSLLGQVTGSVDTADYFVLMIGPTIVRASVKDLSTEDGYLFVAEMLGGTPPSAFDYSKQNDLGFGFAVSMDAITRVDTHGELKLQVQADGSDTDESQIRVLNAAGDTTMWTVDEDGDVVAQGTGTFTAGIILPDGSESVMEDGSELILELGSFIGVESFVAVKSNATLAVWADGVFEVHSTGRFDLQSGSTVTIASEPDLQLGMQITGDIKWTKTDATPTIQQPRQDGTGGADGFPLALEAQQGQTGVGTGGDGGNLTLGIGRGGSGAVGGAPGKLVKQWGDVGGFKWRDYEACSSEVAYTTSAVFPLVLDIADGDLHIAEVYIFARDVAGGTNTKMSLHRVSFQRTGASVAEGNETIEWTVGAADVTFILEVVNPDKWRLKVQSGASSGDCVAFVRWFVVSLDGS